MDDYSGTFTLMRSSLIDHILMIRLPHIRKIGEDAYKGHYQFWSVVTDDFGDIVVVGNPY